jgi:hypothetical protein
MPTRVPLVWGTVVICGDQDDAHLNFLVAVCTSRRHLKEVQDSIVEVCREREREKDSRHG